MTVYRVQPAKSSDLSYPKARPAFDENFIETKTLDPSMTFSRSSGGTYVGPDGLIKIAGVNQPRFDHDPITGESLGLLVEQDSTNLITHSNTLFSNRSTAPQALGNISGTIYYANNAVISPDGTQNASIIYAGGTGYMVTNTFSSYTGSRTFSAYLKVISGVPTIGIWKGAGGDVNLYYNTSTEQFTIAGTSSTITNYGVKKFNNDWYWLWMVMNYSGTWEVGVHGASQLPNTNVAVWGVQFENGTFPTSLITTSGTSLTRAADKPIINRSINTSGTLFAEATTPRTSGTIASADNGTRAIAITLNNANTSRYALYYNTNRYLQISSNTSSIPTEVLQTQIPTGLNRVSLGYSELGSSSYINGHIRRFTYYSSPLSESNVKALVGNTNNVYRDSIGIVTPGLVLNLDAGNIVSYSGGGNTWFDLSGNGNNGTLTNGPTYSNANNGSIVFDGTNDYVTIPSSSSFNFASNNFSVELITFYNASTSTDNTYRYGLFIGTNISSYLSLVKWRSGLSNGFIVDYAVSGNRYVINTGTSTPSPVVNLTSSSPLYDVHNKWSHFLVSVRSNVMTLYINGTSVGSVNINERWNSNMPVYIGSNSTPAEVMSGLIPVVRIYNNNGLTATEVQQNFNAIRGRYGI